ncbi:MAG: UDP-N-acetylmuramate dehydrogenase [Gammaproteobacteria bacterium]|nr:MAG: UDP-N-acetylmuramate dehydrogenase [Gammaproteobacteria bacterium]
MIVHQHKSLQGEMHRDHPLASYTSFQAGGSAEIFYRPMDMNDLRTFLEMLPENSQLTWLGLGSNTLVREGGIKGAVICTRKTLGKISVQGNQVYAEAGVSCAKLAKVLARYGLSGGEFFAGIPGTVGGALAMNAGAFGSETWDFVEEIEVIHRDGKITAAGREAFDVGYRNVMIPEDQWFCAARFVFHTESSESARSNIRNLLYKRNTSQPIGLPSFGSVFKNPEGEHAAKIIERCGLKGYRVGGAYVSDKHANFIINSGTATAEDAVKLIEYIQGVVKEQTGYFLEPEVRIIGDAP